MKINPNILRKKVIDMVVAKQSGHIGGAFSMAELTAVLYEDYDIGGKDKLILSKGHAVPIIYAVLHETGQISDEELDSRNFLIVAKAIYGFIALAPKDRSVA